MHNFEFEQLDVKYIGPNLDEGIKPTYLYFSLCALESLTVDPYNQPAIFLQNEGFRVFSITLPGHGNSYDKFKAMEYWSKNIDELQKFIGSLHKFIDHLVEKKFINIEQFAVGGLSRGGYIATELLTHKSIKYNLSFSPVTDLKGLKEFENITIETALDLNSKFEKLYDKTIRFYIGNRDQRVGTKKCFKFIYTLADFAYHKRIRSPKIELELFPSTGFEGHGTLPETFKSGALWLKNKLLNNVQ